jgi:hypothetical protein
MKNIKNNDPLVGKNNLPMSNSEYDNAVDPLYIDMDKDEKNYDKEYIRSLLPNIKWHKPFIEGEKEELRKKRKELAKGKAGRKKGDGASWADYVEDNPEECHGYNRRHLEKILDEKKIKKSLNNKKPTRNSNPIIEDDKQLPNAEIAKEPICVDIYKRESGTVLVRVYIPAEEKYRFGVVK